jgi:hypothetical protein
MNPELAVLVRDWHDFYAHVGTAAATLVGLMFVAASIRANVFNEKDRAPMNAFVTPTVEHFSIALLIAILATIPTQTSTMRGFSPGCGGLAGLIYSGRIRVRIFNRFGSGIDLPDRVFYALVPVLGYLAANGLGDGTANAGALGSRPHGTGADCPVGRWLRNAWDMTVRIVTRSNNRESRDRGDSAPQS